MATIRINIKTNLDTSKGLRNQGQVFERVFGHINILDWGTYSNLNKFWVEIDESEKSKFVPHLIDSEEEDGTKMVMDEFRAERSRIFKNTAWARERHIDNVELSIDDSVNWNEWLQYYQDLRDMPSMIKSFGTTANESTTVVFEDTSDMAAGMTIEGENIPADSTISSVDSATNITISAAATGNGKNIMRVKSKSGRIIFDVYNPEFPEQPQ